jgi:hypothetical protein
MPAPSRWVRVTCPACSASSLWGPQQVLDRLRTVGLLRRQKEPDWDLIYEVFPSAVDRMVCSQCGQRGLSVAEAEDEWDDEPSNPGRCCSGCGQPIPPERLAAFPDTQRCITCQQTAERGEDASEPEYCPRCGTPMQLQRRRGSGLAGYQMVCPECRR